MHHAATAYRTHTNGDLRKQDQGKRVKLAGWVSTRRDHGSIVFIDLRDRYGLTQVVFDPEVSAEHMKLAETLRREDVIAVEGTVELRKEGMANPKLATGEIEVFVDKLDILARSETPPFEIDDRVVASEEMRLQYRFLDLRRPIMQRNLQMRAKIVAAGRDYFNDHGFVEIETPLLVKPTPEGARDYLVPSRVNPGKFYALPQSPQLYKQISMIAGFDRYFQVARCLRDEDLRADRQPEHTQFDLEMSFVSAQDVRDFVEGLYKHMVKAARGIDIAEPFAVMTYQEAMDRYGTDKPDLRYGLELHDVTQIVKHAEFGVFRDVERAGGVIKALCVPKDLPRKEIDDLIEFSKQAGSKGMAWMRVSENGLESNIAKYFSQELQQKLVHVMGAKPGNILMFIADRRKQANAVLDKLRQEIAKRLGLIDPFAMRFLWVIDFPMFAFNDETQMWEPEHHLFTSPTPQTIEHLESDPGKVVGNLYDLVLNGTELGSGSIRISNPELQEQVMKVIGLSKEQAYAKFGFLLNAYKYGGPPHGGMGLGVDRFVALLLGTNDIREVIAFPKNKAAECPMDGSPSEPEPHQLKELHIKMDIVKKS